MERLMMIVSLCVAVFASHAALFFSLDTVNPLRGVGLKKKKQDFIVSVALRPYF